MTDYGRSAVSISSLANGAFGAAQQAHLYDHSPVLEGGYLIPGHAPEGWLSGLRQRMHVRYTGNRIGGSNPSPSATWPEARIGSGVFVPALAGSVP
jgi:hypothetical protein